MQSILKRFLFTFKKSLKPYWRSSLSALAGKQITNIDSRYLGRNVRIDILLPPDYFKRYGPYPVVYFNDGQDFPALQMEATLTSLYKQNMITPTIMVAIYAGDRMHEYGTANIPDYLHRGSKAADYSHFILRELLPYLRNNFRCRIEPAYNTFAGFSLGGLSALDIVWNHPNYFGRVGVFSGSLWWRSEPFEEKDPDANRIMHEIISKGPKREGLHFWLQAGTDDEKEDRNKNGIIDAIDDTLDLIKELEKLGYKKGKEITYVEVEGGQHNQKTWGAVMPEFLEWAIGVRRL